MGCKACDEIRAKVLAGILSPSEGKRLLGEALSQAKEAFAKYLEDRRAAGIPKPSHSEQHRYKQLIHMLEQNYSLDDISEGPKSWR